MKSIVFWYATAAAVLLLASASATCNDDKKDEAPPGDKPGQIHKDLASRAGEYETVTKFWTAPGEKPMESKGAVKITSMVEGRFIMEEGTGSLFGQPIKSLKLMGYNNGTKKYEATWTYSMSTAMMNMTGTSKDDGKTIDWTASFTGPDGEKQSLYLTTKFIDANSFVVELYAKDKDGKKSQTLETTYKRKK